MEDQLVFGNWIRKKILIILGSCTIGTFVLIFIPLGFFYRILMTCVCIFTAFSFLFPFYSYLMFSQKGARFQEKVYQLIIQNLGDQVTGRILDIGSGNGILAVKLAQQNPEVKVTGIDNWGKEWEYSKSNCERNAKVGQVEKRIRFQQGDAAKLAFNNGAFDAVVSNLTFHEVRSIEDKREAVRDALRVVKPGGRFAFIDYFYDRKFYGKPSEFKTYLKNMKLSQLEYRPLKELIPLPFLLRHPRILGKGGMIYGNK